MATEQTTDRASSRHPARIDAIDLVNAAGIAEMYGVSRSAVSNWEARDARFPAPLQLPGVVGIPLWDRREVIAWREAKRPHPERCAIRMSRPGHPDAWIRSGVVQPQVVAPYSPSEAVATAQRMQDLADSGRTEPASFSVHPYPYETVRA